MFDCRTNRTPIERLGSIGSIGFWFGFVRLATPGLPAIKMGLSEFVLEIKKHFKTKCRMSAFSCAIIACLYGTINITAW